MQFSICIPVYNRSQLVVRAIQSCLCQTGNDFEIVVVDDGSTDDTCAAVESIGDARIKLVRQETNRGLSTTRNSCVAAAVGEWIIWLDSDDELVPQGLEIIRRTIASSESGVECWEFMYRRDDGELSPQPPLTDGWLDYDVYLRRLDLQTRFDPLFCIRRSVVGRVSWKPWALSGTVLQRLELHRLCCCATSSHVVGLIHTDATNRISWIRRGPRVARLAAQDLGEEMDEIFRLHGERLRAIAPRTWQRFQRVRASYFFLAGERLAGFRQTLACLLSTPLTLEVWLQLVAGLTGPRLYATIRNLLPPPT